MPDDGMISVLARYSNTTHFQPIINSIARWVSESFGTKGTLNMEVLIASPINSLSS